VINALDELLGPHIFPVKADGGDPRQCPSCEGGRLSLKLGRFGAFIGCSNYPECRYTRALSAPEGGAEGATKRLGLDPATGLEVTLRVGRFGPYVQLGESNNGEKPKRTALPKGVSRDDVDLVMALGLLGLPREVGRHPESGDPIMAGIGRFGAYVQHGKTYAGLEPGDDVLAIGLNRAVTLIAEKQAKGGRGRRFAADPGRPLGEHPAKGGAVVAKNGRYGPYVSHDGVNATLPADKTPETVTLDEAVALIDAKAGDGSTPPKQRTGAARKGAKRAPVKAPPAARAPRKPAKRRPARKAAVAPKRRPSKPARKRKPAD
jgi:DNA topoisomerase I